MRSLTARVDARLPSLADRRRNPAVLSSAYSPKDLELATDPTSAAWANAPRVRPIATTSASRSPDRRPSPLALDNEHLYLLYICPYDELNLKPEPDPTAETPRLWNWDVAEAFIGSDFEQHRAATRNSRYRRKVNGWISRSIATIRKGQAGAKWNSGIAVAARIDSQAKIWYGVMRIPFSAIDTRPPEKGRELRAGLYRIAGVGEAKKHYAWRPTGQTSFHVPFRRFAESRIRRDLNQNGSEELNR